MKKYDSPKMKKLPLGEDIIQTSLFQADAVGKGANFANFHYIDGLFQADARGKGVDRTNFEK